MVCIFNYVLIQYTLMLSELDMYVYENFQAQKSIVCLSCTHAFLIVQMKDFSIFALTVINSSTLKNTKKYSTLGNSYAHTLLHPLISIKKSKMNEHLKFLRAANEFPISIFNSLIHRTDYLMNWNSSLLNCIPSDKIWYLIIACESKIQPFFKDREKGSERSINYYYYFARRTSQLERRAIEKKKKIGGIFKDITLNLNFTRKKNEKKKSQEDLLYVRKVGSSWKE